MGIPRITLRSVALGLTSSPYSTRLQRAGVGVSIRGECRIVGKCKQGCDNGGGTPDKVIVVAVFAVVLMSVIWVGIVVAPRVAGVVHELDVLGDLLGPVGRRRQTIKCTSGRSVKREEE